MNPEHFMQNNREADAYILFYNLKKNSQIIITKLNKVKNKEMTVNKMDNDISMQSIKSSNSNYMSFEILSNEINIIGEKSINIPNLTQGKYIYIIDYLIDLCNKKI
jgi:hypothetical protein